MSCLSNLGSGIFVPSSSMANSFRPRSHPQTLFVFGSSSTSVSNNTDAIFLVYTLDSKRLLVSLRLEFRKGGTMVKEVRISGTE